MDHKSFLRSLSGDESRALTERSDRAGLRQLAGHAGLLVLGAVWIANAWPLWWLVLPLHGVALVFLFTLEHEATHKTPFESERLNEWVGWLCGVLLLLPFEWFRYFHLAHHRWTNIPGKDPELEDEDAKYSGWAPFLWYVSGLSYWVGGVRGLLATAWGRPLAAYVPARAEGRIRREARVMLALYALAGLSLLISPLLFWIWILPALLGQPVLRLYLMAEHGRCPQVADMFDNTRTTYTSRLLRFLAWNMPYHTEHHVFPAVPFHRLPALHQRMKPHLRHTENGYARFSRDTVAGL